MLQSVVDQQTNIGALSLRVDGQAEGLIALQSVAIGCSNSECLRTTVHATIGTGHYDNGVKLKPGHPPLFSQRLMPQGTAKPQPEYIPIAIKEDYYEACLIQELSPKASATLTRRCLQGMIRDFAGISKNRLVDEIDALRRAIEDGSVDRSVTPETVEAINHVRSVGNIGAHMEKDIDLIVPVDQGEAQALIELIEMLFEEWYGARERRKARLARIESISVEKQTLKTGLKDQKILPQPDN